MTQQDEDLLLVGTIAGPFGIRGEVKVQSATDRPDHLRRLKKVLLGPERRLVRLRRVIEHKPGVLVLGFEDVRTREQAEELRGQELYIRESEAAPLAEDEYFLHQMVGLAVVTVDGRDLGKVAELIETGSNEVLIVKGEAGEVLVPMIKDVVRSIDVPAGRITIEPLPGML